MDDLLNYCLIDGCVTEFFDFINSIKEPEMMLEHQILGNITGFGTKIVTKLIPVSEEAVMAYLTA